MVDFRIIDTLSMHNQPPKFPNPLNPPCQGDFGNFERVEVVRSETRIGKCILISRVYYNSI